MLQHLEDNGDHSVFANDAGDLLILCTTCKRTWTYAPPGDGGGAKVPSRSITDFLSGTVNSQLRTFIDQTLGSAGGPEHT